MPTQAEISEMYVRLSARGDTTTSKDLADLVAAYGVKITEPPTPEELLIDRLAARGAITKGRGQGGIIDDVLLALDEAGLKIVKA